jgi:hypothetical protein
MTPGLAYHWKTPPGASTSAKNKPVLITNAPGAYTLTTTYTVNSCSSEIEVLVYACVGLSEYEKSALILAYPNPFTNVLYVESNNTSECLGLVEITSSDGRSLTSRVIRDNKVSFDLSFLKAGIYFLRVKSANGLRTSKIVKQ